MSHGSQLRDENAAAINNANSACPGKCRAAIFKGGNHEYHANVSTVSVPTTASHDDQKSA